MTLTQRELAGTLGELLDACKSSQANFQAASANVPVGALKLLYQRFAQQRSEFAKKLQALAQQHNEAPDADDGTAESVERGFMNIAASMTIQDSKTEQVVHANILASEAETQQVYAAALEQDLPQDVDAVVAQQYAALRAAEEELREVNGRYAYERIIIGLYRNSADADRLVRNLQHAGYTDEQISVLAHEDTLTSNEVQESEETVKESTTAGAVGGGVVGGLVGLIAGVSTSMAPSIGPVMATGAWAASLGITAAGAGIGAAYGSFFGALIGQGTAEENEIYLDTLRKGGILIAVHANTDDVADVVSLMEKANPIRLHAHNAEPVAEE